MTSESPRVDPKDVEAAFDVAIGAAGDLQGRFIEGAQNMGYIRESLERARPYYVAWAEKSRDDQGLTAMASSGAAFVKSYGQQIYRLASETVIPLSGIRTAAGTVEVFVANTSSNASLAAVPSLGEFSYEPNPFRTGADSQAYSERFVKLDSALGGTYREIWEVLYGTRADPVRPCLFLIRQAFDHLFGRLAPDTEVRSSKHWLPKSGEKPDQVYREERIEYAAFTHIKDPRQARTHAEQAKQMSETYNQLNRAHERGGLDKDKATKALMAMKRLLEDWADALGL